MEQALTSPIRVVANACMEHSDKTALPVSRQRRRKHTMLRLSGEAKVDYGLGALLHPREAQYRSFLVDCR